ncbi:MAG: hypothetical protein K2G16_02600, partial [Lachnospiraceae bacterium]|nr:hypothetical protein [Lachnospiraceae bacterium]
VSVQSNKNVSFFTIHLLNYNYDSKEDKVQPLANVHLSARLPENAKTVRCTSLDGSEPECSISMQEGRLDVLLRKMPLYVVMEVQCA